MFVPEGLIDSKLALVQVVAWHWIGTISLSKPILTKLYYAICCHKASNALPAEMVFILHCYYYRNLKNGNNCGAIKLIEKM